jgi:hypothetical protein
VKSLAGIYDRAAASAPNLFKRVCRDYSSTIPAYAGNASGALKVSDMSTIEQLEERMDALEEKVRKGVQGPRGPAGDVNAAVNNARETMKEELASTLRRAEALHRAVESTHAGVESRIRNVSERTVNAMRQRHDDFKTAIEDQVAEITLKILREYWVLGENNEVLDHLQRPPVKS